MLRWLRVAPGPCALVALLVTSRASADPAASRCGIDVTWVRDDGAEACPDAESFQRSLRGGVAGASVHSPATLRIDAVVSRSHDAWAARLVVRDLSGGVVGVRDISDASPSCAPIVEAVQVAIALLHCEDRAPSPEAHPAPPPTSRRPLVATVSAVGAWGALPSLAPGLSVDVTVGLWSRLRWSAGVTGLLPTTHTRGAATLSLSLVAAQVGLGVALVRADRFDLEARASVQAGAMVSSVEGAPPIGDEARLWLSALAGVRARVALTARLSLAFDLAAWVPVTRYAFVDAAAAPPYLEPSPVGVAGGVGAAWSFH